MAWKRPSVMEQKEEFVLRALQPRVNFSDLCREYGISRKTGYKWLKRFREKGLRGLEELKRGPRPGGGPLRCTGELALEIVNLRQAHPTWGPKKLRAVMLRTRAPEEVPSARTIGRVLERAGLVAFRRQRRRRRGGEVARPGVLVVCGRALRPAGIR